MAAFNFKSLCHLSLHPQHSRTHYFFTFSILSVNNVLSRNTRMALTRVKFWWQFYLVGTLFDTFFDPSNNRKRKDKLPKTGKIDESSAFDENGISGCFVIIKKKKNDEEHLQRSSVTICFNILHTRLNNSINFALNKTR